MSSELLVSVVLAVFNGDSHLSMAIDSVLAQSFVEFELIIIDDGSQDTTPDILKRYLSDSRVKCIRNEHNLGLSRSLNIGIVAARGKYIARLDADDIAEPDRLRQQVEFLQNNYPTVLVGSWARHIDSDGVELSIHKLPSNDNELQWLMFFVCPFYHSAVMFDRCKVVENVGLYNDKLSYSMDYEYWFRIASRFAVANINSVLISYRETSNSMTGKLKTEYTEGYWIQFGIVSSLLNWNYHDTARYQRINDIMCKIVVDPFSIKSVSLVDYILAVRNIFNLRKEYVKHFNVGRFLGDDGKKDQKSVIKTNIRPRGGFHLHGLIYNVRKTVFYSRLYVRLLIKKSK